MSNTDNSKNPSFSTAEIPVVELLTKGLSEKEIADTLNLSPHTVSNHLRNVRARNKVQKNTEIILLYIAYLSKNKVTFKQLKEFGLSILFVMINICDYTRILN